MDAEALEDLLHWLVQGAVRLKALLADTAGGVGVAAETWTIPAGIMPPFPEKSSFGQVRRSLRLARLVIGGGRLSGKCLCCNPYCVGY